MKDTWKYWVNKEGKPMTGGYYNFKNFKVYWAFRKYIGERISEYDFNESFTGQFIKSGFTYPKGLNPTNNWFGVSRYEPDLVMNKGDKELVMSLQGVMTPYNDKFDQLFEATSIKYIRMTKGNDLIYENWTGNLPNKELVKEFING